MVEHKSLLSYCRFRPIHFQTLVVSTACYSGHKQVNYDHPGECSPKKRILSFFSTELIRNISNTRKGVPSDLETPRSVKKKRGAACGQNGDTPFRTRRGQDTLWTTVPATLRTFACNIAPCVGIFNLKPRCLWRILRIDLANKHTFSNPVNCGSKIENCNGENKD